MAMTEQLRESIRVLNQYEALNALLGWLVNVARILPKSAKTADAYAWVVIRKDTVIEGNKAYNVVLRAVFIHNDRSYEGEVDVIETTAYEFRHGSLVPLDIPRLVRTHGNEIPIAPNQLWLFKVRVLERVGYNAEAEDQ